MWRRGFRPAGRTGKITTAKAHRAPRESLKPTPWTNSRLQPGLSLWAICREPRVKR